MEPQPVLPNLRRVDVASLKGMPKPAQKIRFDSDVEVWRTTRSYQDYSIFLHRLTEAVVGQFLPLTNPTQSSAILGIIGVLDRLDRWIDDIPPLNSPQRFGNLAFRKWGKRLEEEADNMLGTLLPSDYAAAIPHLKPYLLASFGSFTRMDYGTGHEASFALFLCCLTLLRFFQPTVEEEKDLVLRVFVRYLQLCWRLQDVYRLEPAGSHGVWGLDDSSFLGYIFGSGQLRDQNEISVAAVLHPPLPATNLYFMSIMRIHEVKRGPFHEHSSQLYAIATGVPNWRKVNSGLFKMYEVEVLAKRVVIQHIPLGGILEWDTVSPSAMVPKNSTGAPWLSPAAEPLNSPMSTGWSTPTPHGSSGVVDSALSVGSDDPRNRAARSTPRTHFGAPP
ncbi:Phosphotyrosyl phosphatase activator [Pleurotus eryngii]|uniref:Serine/threonine-protein phosphatase 2A activator n=1 Tax=Pleurotus eryngii TaxID=5323 RepID=A0A9P6DJZ1_PLEER|nr:Phosphotyrosyl phosphatase activator [Pleurotus eryngii]